MKYIIRMVVGFVLGYLLGMLFVSTGVFAADSCKEVSTVNSAVKSEDINTAVPKALEGAVIEVKLKNGKVYVFKADEFKVVPRMQQLLVTEYEVTKTLRCDSSDKNTLMLGIREDHTGLDVSATANAASVQSRRGPVLDAAYLRRKILDTKLGVGAGIDTNGTVKGIVGLDF